MNIGRSIFIAALVMLGIISLAQTKGMMVDAPNLLPPKDIAPDERVLDHNEIALLSCTRDVRRATSDRPGIMMNSEKVSYSDKFGYLYRYEGEHVSNNHHVSKYVVVFWTTDCVTAKMAYYPLFELPGTQSN